MNVVFEQCLLATKVSEENGNYTISVSALDNPTISIEFDTENDAKIFYSALQTKYIEALRKLQEAVTTAL